MGRNALIEILDKMLLNLFVIEFFARDFFPLAFFMVCFQKLGRFFLLPVFFFCMCSFLFNVSQYIMSSSMLKLCVFCLRSVFFYFRNFLEAIKTFGVTPRGNILLIGHTYHTFNVLSNFAEPFFFLCVAGNWFFFR